MERDRLKLAFAGHFFSFKLPSKPKKKIKILKKCKKLLEISSLCTCSPKIMIIWCTVPQIWSETDRNFFVILSHFLPFYPLPNDPKKSKFCKNKKRTWWYNHFTHVYQKSQSYHVCFLRYGVQQMFLSFWAIFCPLTTWKIKILKNEKLPGDFIIYKSTTNDNHMMYGS